jgi:hypothetical protein
MAINDDPLWNPKHTFVSYSSFEAVAMLRSEQAIERARLADAFIREKYSQSVAFQESLNFLKNDLVDCMRSDIESVGRLWLFPAFEAWSELLECLNRIIECSYKASRDNMRRALELILVGAYLSQSHISPDEAKLWLKSMSETPFFSKTVKRLVALPRFDMLKKMHQWDLILKEFYFGLCNTIHTNGEKHSLNKIQPVSRVINSVRVPSLNEEALRISLDLYLETVGHIALILAAYNPVLLVGLPLFEKFGDNPPMCGYFEEAQSERLWGLISPEYRPTLQSIVKTDEEVLEVEKWMDGLPDQI